MHKEISNCARKEQNVSVGSGHSAGNEELSAPAVPRGPGGLLFKTN